MKRVPFPLSSVSVAMTHCRFPYRFFARPQLLTRI